MKTIAILAGIMTTALVAHAQSTDYLQRNHKFHKQVEKNEKRTISSAMTALEPMERNRKLHMSTVEIIPIPVYAAGDDSYLVRNRKFHKTNPKEATPEKKFKNDFPKPPVLSSN